MRNFNHLFISHFKMDFDQVKIEPICYLKTMNSVKNNCMPLFDVSTFFCDIFTNFQFWVFGMIT